MKNLTKLSAFLLALLCFACLPASAERGETTPYSWYFAKNDRHERPTLDSNLEFVSDYDCVFLGKNEKVIYLTFDAGYENGNVEKILDILKREQVPGAFFVLGNLITQNPELIRRMADEGHLVCNHSYAHKDMTGWSEAQIRDELTRLEDTCRETCGIEIAKYFRPPEGRFSRSLLESVNKMGYKTVFWSFAYADWDNARQPDTAKAAAKVLDNVHNGAVILLHPTSATNAAILGNVIAALKADGYRFGTLDELTAQHGSEG